MVRGSQVHWVVILVVLIVFWEFWVIVFGGWALIWCSYFYLFRLGHYGYLLLVRLAGETINDQNKV